MIELEKTISLLDLCVTVIRRKPKKPLQFKSVGLEQKIDKVKVSSHSPNKKKEKGTLEYFKIYHRPNEPPDHIQQLT